MSEELRAYLLAFVAELSDAIDRDLPRARRILDAVRDGAGNIESDILGFLDEAILEEIQARARLEQQRAALVRIRVLANGSEPKEIPPKVEALAGTVRDRLTRWRNEGGGSVDSAEAVAAEISEELEELRRLARERKTAPRLAVWIERHLTIFSRMLWGSLR